MRLSSNEALVRPQKFEVVMIMENLCSMNIESKKIVLNEYLEL